MNWICLECGAANPPANLICGSRDCQARRWRESLAPYQKKRIPAWMGVAVYERDGFFCQECGAVDDLTLDHIFPEVHGGPTDPENLRVLCRSCNSRKGAKLP